MATKPAAGTYTVDTGHAKCPDHLYMFDEGSGTSVADQGKTGGLDLTLTNTPTWGTDDLGALGGAGASILSFDSAASEYGRSAASFSVDDNGSIFICAIFKTANASAPGATEAIVSVGNSANTTDFATLRNVSSTGYLTLVYDDSAVASSSQNTGVDINDQAWHIGTAFCYHSSTPSMRMRIAMDGGTRVTSSGSTGEDVIQNLNRIAVASNAGSSTGAHFDGSLAAVFIYKNASAPDTDWNQTFMDELAADPWQFLNTGGHPAASRARGVPGMNSIASRFGRGW